MLSTMAFLRLTFEAALAFVESVAVRKRRPKLGNRR